MLSAVSILLAAVGILLAAGGAWLLGVGGSWFYLAFGLATMLTAVLLWRRQAAALWLYAAILLATLAWAVWEVGLDWWALAPRGDVPVLLGFLLILPWTVRGLTRSSVPQRRAAWAGLGGAVVVSIVVAIIAYATPTHELAGSLPSRPEMAQAETPEVPDGEWHAYGRTSFGDRYSPLDQITPANVGRLEEVWRFQTGDVRGPQDPEETTYEVTPLKIGDTIYLCTPHNLVFALDAETGTEKWRFDPDLAGPPKDSTQHLTCRGVSYDDGAGRATAPSGDCSRRLFLPTADARLIALSAATGRICPGFGGEDGTVDLWANMPNVTIGSYYSTSPPVIAGDRVIIGGAVNDNVSTNETSGVIRAFDVDTGELLWNFDSLDPEETAPIGPGETYTANSPNSWSVSSYDPELGLVYVPMGNQPPDQFGGNRGPNAERFSSSITALRVESGEVAWVFQGVHHDLWDMDMPAQPSLVDLTIDGETVPALVAPTKQGEIFVLDRRTGEPVLPVTEVPAPQGAAPGDFTAPTQPVSALSFRPEPLTGASMWGATPFDQLWCRIRFRSLRYEGRYTPPSLQGTIVYPGNFGTFNWGGVAVDPVRQVMFAMPVYLAFTVKLIERPEGRERVVTEQGSIPLNENFGAPYAVEMGPLMSPIGLPCQQPPWGYVAGADLTTGIVAYRHVNGTVRDLAPIPLPIEMGVPGIGGPIVTKGGVAFLSGTLDYFVRGYDLMTGQKLWENRLPAGGQATPMTYWSEASQRQFLLVVAGGHGSTGTEAGDSIIAYALPKAG